MCYTIKIDVTYLCLILVSDTMSLKRKADDAGIAHDDKKKDPIPRHLPLKSVTIELSSNLTWEEIGPGQLCYLPTSVNPFYTLTKNDLNKWNKFKSLWETMEIHTPQVEIANLIMLQDDLRVQSNTPTDATAFTQVCYLMQYSPVGQTEYFAFENINSKPLTYELDYIGDKDTQLIKIGEIDYENFETLRIRQARINSSAGWLPDQETLPNKQLGYRIEQPYLPPYLVPNYACNLNIPHNNLYYLNQENTPGYARNNGHISYHKYGDVIQVPITTNLEGVKLYADSFNDWTAHANMVRNSGDDTIIYTSEWMYPGNNRPFRCRCTNFHTNYCIEHNKGFKPLQHHFFSMPPIKKPNGALLGQRCAFTLQTKLHVTFHFHESTYEGWETEGDCDMLSQNHAVSLRRGIYGDVHIGNPPPIFDGGPLCPYGIQSTYYRNDWTGFFHFMYDSTESIQKSVIKIHTVNRPSAAQQSNTYDLEEFNFRAKGEGTFLDMESYMPINTEYMQRFLANFRIPKTTVFFYKAAGENKNWLHYDYTEKNSEGEDIRVRYWVTCFVTSRTNSTTPVMVKRFASLREEQPFSDSGPDTWIELNINALDEAIALSDRISCKPPAMHSDYNTVSRRISAFFV